MVDSPPIIWVNKASITGRSDQIVIIEFGEDVRPDATTVQSVVRLRIAMTPTVLLGLGKLIAQTIGYKELPPATGTLPNQV